MSGLDMMMRSAGRAGQQSCTRTYVRTGTVLRTFGTLSVAQATLARSICLAKVMSIVALETSQLVMTCRACISGLIHLSVLVP